MVKHGSPRRKKPGNIFFLILVLLFSILVLISNLLAIFFSYKQRKEELLSGLNLTYAQLDKEYETIIDNFWKIYMPIFENKQDYDQVWAPYFDSDSSLELDIFYYRSLETSLNMIMRENEDIQWLVLYDPNREENYIVFADSTGMKLLPDDFPYIEPVASSGQSMQVFGMETISRGSTSYRTFAISGGIPAHIGKGWIIAGYSLSNFESICRNSLTALKSVNYVLTSNGEIVFDYRGTYDPDLTYRAEKPMTETKVSFRDDVIFTSSKQCARRSSMLSFYASYGEISRYCHQNTPFLTLIFAVFFTAALLLYLIMQRFIRKEVGEINAGLQVIAGNDLSYRITTNFHQDVLSEIAGSINEMTRQLKANMEKAHYHEWKQREAELSDLQSKFNPHFLYNILEQLRARCELNGDDASASMVTQLATIFRGFLNNKLFIPIPEELARSKQYMVLFGYGYQDQVDIQYDFDSDILQYGIISNIFQPLIENYFVHGFDTENEENCILFRGRSLDEKTMLLSMEDNGLGMTAEEISQLCDRLDKPIRDPSESYGLKNLQQRLRLFYGQDYGLTIHANSPKGISVEICVPKITCAEYENRPKATPPQ